MILNWLSVVDSSTNYNAARSKHEEGTGDWFLNGKRFEDWKTASNSVLWLHGKGKYEGILFISGIPLSFR
jgi:hypothetical protein